MHLYGFFYTIGSGHTDFIVVEAPSFQEALNRLYAIRPTAQIIDWEQVA